MRVLGIDEAGRGPVLGPLVVAGVLTEEPQALRTLGVRDSKRLSPPRRRGLAEEIRRVARWQVLTISAEEVDAGMEEGSLNLLEAHAFARLIRDLAPAEAVVDCCDPVEERFRRTLLRLVGYDLPLRAEHGADGRHPVVAAASILAKVERDAAVARIEAEVGRPVGSGYAHDPVTVAFVEDWIAAHGSPPPHVRRRWKTTRRLLSRAGVRRLTEWE